MTLRRFPLALALFLLAIAAVLPAHAAEPGNDALPIHVIGVAGSDIDDQVEALTKALRNAVRAMPGWSLAGGDYSLEVITLSLKCPEPPDPPCQARIADHIKADRYVWGTLKKKGTNVAGELNLWVRGKGSTKAPVDYSANLTEPNEDALKKIAMDSMLQLTGGSPKGGLHVKVGSVPGQLFIDGQPVGALANGEGTFQIASGSRVVTVKAPGYVDAETTVVVKANTTSEVNLTLVKESAKSPANMRRNIGYGLIGFGIASAVGGGVTSGLQLANQDEFNKNPYTSQPGKGLGVSDVCSVAAGDTSGNKDAEKMRDTCGKGSLFSGLQFLFYGLAIVSAGTGIYLVGTSPSTASKPSAAGGLKVTPLVAPGAGRLDVSYTF